MAVIITGLDELTDLTIGDVTFKIKPLDVFERSRLLKYYKTVAGDDVEDQASQAVLTVKMCLKGLKGVEDQNGKPYKLEFDERGDLTNSCLTQIFQLESAPEFTKKCVDVAMRSLNPGIKAVVESPKKRRSKKK